MSYDDIDIDEAKDNFDTMNADLNGGYAKLKSTTFIEGLEEIDIDNCTLS